MFPRPRVAALLACCALAVLAVSPPAGAASPQAPAGPATATRPVPADEGRAGTGSIGGRALSGDRAPLAGARITLLSSALAEARVALSRADGGYSFAHLPAGAYTITATHSGFVSRSYS